MSSAQLAKETTKAVIRAKRSITGNYLLLLKGNQDSSLPPFLIPTQSLSSMYRLVIHFYKTARKTACQAINIFFGLSPCVATKGCFLKEMCQEAAAPTFLVLIVRYYGHSKILAQEHTSSLCWKMSLYIKTEESPPPPPRPPPAPVVIYKGVTGIAFLRPSLQAWSDSSRQLFPFNFHSKPVMLMIIVKSGKV